MSENSITLYVKKGDEGLWYVTSPEPRGLLVTGDTMHNALMQTQKALDEMASAEAAPPAWMVEVAREAGAQTVDRTRPETARRYRSGEHDRMSVVTAVCVAFQLALSRGHVVEPREWTEEELLKAAREDAAQVAESRHPKSALGLQIRQGDYDESYDVRAALQARRNVLSEIRAVAAPAVPEVDLEDVLERAWENGWSAAGLALSGLKLGAIGETKLFDGMRETDVSRLLSTLPTRGA